MKTYTTDSPGSDGAERIKVGVADYAIADGSTALTTSGLGSCLGIALCDVEAGVAGLAHAMLPDASAVEDPEHAKFVDTAIERLLAELRSVGAEEARIVAKLAGGSNMLDFSGVGERVGSRNAAAAREKLAEAGVPVVGEDVGGSHGRSLELVPADGTLTITSAHVGVTEL